MFPIWLSLAIKVFAVFAVVIGLEATVTRGQKPAIRILILGAGVILAVLVVDAALPAADPVTATSG